MKNYIKEGKRITYKNSSGSTISAGSVVAVGNIIGIACTDIANTATGALAINGVFEVPKVSGASGHAIAQGEKVLWDASAAKFDLGTATPATGDISNCCVAVEAAATTATTVMVKINVGVGTVA